QAPTRRDWASRATSAIHRSQSARGQLASQVPDERRQSGRQWSPIVALAASAIFALGLFDVSAAQTLTTGREAEELRKGSWHKALEQMDVALARGDSGAASRAWHAAYLAAQASRAAVGLLDVGDAYLRIGEAVKDRRSAEPTAHRLYLTALFRAR